MEKAAKLRVKAFHCLQCRAESRLIFSLPQKKEKKSSLTGCQKLVKILLRKTQPHLSGIKGNLLWTSVGCSSSAGILHSLLSTQKHSKKKKKSHPQTIPDGILTSVVSWVCNPFTISLTKNRHVIWALISALICFHKPFQTSSQPEAGSLNQPIFDHTIWQQLTPLGTEWYWRSMIVFLQFVSKRDKIQCCLSSVLSDGVRPDQVFI